MATTHKNTKLKAYARYDGSGRIIPGQLVLRTRKPVGNWKEVQAYECCTTTSTTSTTTTTSSTTTTTTL